MAIKATRLTKKGSTTKQRPKADNGPSEPRKEFLATLQLVREAMRRLSKRQKLWKRPER